jgi:acyl-CoA dehydrogenase
MTLTGERRTRTRNSQQEFVDVLAEEGWIGALIPEEYGRPGMTTAEVVFMMEEIAASGGGLSAAQAIHGGIYNVPPMVNYGSEEMKEKLLPKLATGEASIQSLGLTEPNAGLDSTSIETFAGRDGDEYVVNGRKIRISYSVE